MLAPVLTDVAERIFTTGRSFGISAVIASQGTALLKAAGGETLLRVLMTNAPMKVIGRLAAPDAELLSREQAPGGGVETSISEVRSRFVGATTNLKDREFLRITPGETTRFRSKDVALDAWRAATQERAADLARVRSRLALPADLEPTPPLAQAVPLETRPARQRGGGRRRRVEPSAPAADQPTAPPPKPRSKWG